jgi:hypothetical protein
VCALAPSAHASVVVPIPDSALAVPESGCLSQYRDGRGRPVDLVESVGSLTPHSVVRDHDGQLFDITPFNDDSLRLGFVEHRGNDATFFEIMIERNQIFCCTVDPDELADYLKTSRQDEWTDEDDPCSEPHE